MRRVSAWGKKLFCSLTEWQQILVYHLQDSSNSRVNRLRHCVLYLLLYFFFKLCKVTSLHRYHWCLVNDCQWWPEVFGVLNTCCRAVHILCQIEMFPVNLTRQTECFRYLWDIGCWKLEGDWTNVLPVTFITLAKASQEKNENIFCIKISLQCHSLLFF